MTQEMEYKIGDKIITSEEWIEELTKEFGTGINAFGSFDFASIREIYKIVKVDKLDNYYLRDHLTGEFKGTTFYLKSFRKATEEEITKDKLKRIFIK
jgi:hypothetical protein